MAARPRRQKKADRLLHVDAQKDEIACDYAVAPFDRVATQMDEKWGIDRLPELVSPETAQRYGFALAHLNECIQERKPAEAAAAAQNCIRGMQALDAEATAAGHQPATGEFWEYELETHDGRPPFRFAILKDGAEWKTLKANRPDLEFYNLREIAIAVQHYASRYPIGEVKELFPAANIVSIKEPCDFKNGGDPIPF